MIPIALLTLRMAAAAGLLILFTACLWLYLRRRRLIVSSLGDREVLEKLLGPEVLTSPRLRIGIVFAAAAALSMALLDPLLAGDPPTHGGPVVLVLDASGSMLVADVDGESRLGRQRVLASDVAASLPETAVGLVAYAGRAFSLAPPTRDRGAIQMYLSTLDPTIVTQSGSSLGAAIRQGMTLLRSPDVPVGGTIVLIGDGDETEGAEEALEAAASARDAGIRLHVVGVGTDAGGPVPALNLATGTAAGVLRDPDGAILVSRQNSELLREIASRARGSYVDANAPDALGTLLASIQDEPADGVENGRFPPYAWLALLSILLLTFEPLSSGRGKEPMP